ncbi:hypothetical protein JCM10296v2_005428 [Rhodotorula toruloides]
MSLPVTAERDDIGGEDAARRDEKDTRRSVGLLNLPDELLVYIFDLLFAAFTRMGPPDYELRLAEVKMSSRLFRLARLALFREITVGQPSEQKPCPPIVAFLAHQSQTFGQTEKLRLPPHEMTGPILAAMIPRLFPNLTTLEVAGSLLRLGCGPALEMLDMTLENVPAKFRIPWQHLKRLNLRIRREETLQLLDELSKDLAAHADDHPCRLKLACLVVHLPWPTGDDDAAEYHHNIVIRSSHALATLLMSLRIRSLHLTGITGWPEQVCVPRDVTLEHLRIQWLDSPITTVHNSPPIPRQ